MSRQLAEHPPRIDCFSWPQARVRYFTDSRSFHLRLWPAARQRVDVSLSVGQIICWGRHTGRCPKSLTFAAECGPARRYRADGRPARPRVDDLNADPWSVVTAPVAAMPHSADGAAAVALGRRGGPRLRRRREHASSPQPPAGQQDRLTAVPVSAHAALELSGRQLSATADWLAAASSSRSPPPSARRGAPSRRWRPASAAATSPRATIRNSFAERGREPPVPP
jgi:hypothetical protein